MSLTSSPVACLSWIAASFSGDASQAAMTSCVSRAGSKMTLSIEAASPPGPCSSRATTSAYVSRSGAQHLVDDAVGVPLAEDVAGEPLERGP